MCRQSVEEVVCEIYENVTENMWKSKLSFVVDASVV